MGTTLCLQRALIKSMALLMPHPAMSSIGVYSVTFLMFFQCHYMPMLACRVRRFMLHACWCGAAPRARCSCYVDISWLDSHADNTYLIYVEPDSHTDMTLVLRITGLRGRHFTPPGFILCDGKYVYIYCFSR